MDFDLKTIYEDTDVLVVIKPAGLSVHGDGRNTEQTLVDWILVHHPEMKGVGELAFAPDGTPIERPGVVHRLDKDTSGVLILAKNQRAHELLKQQFQDRKTDKVYKAIVYGLMKDDVGLIQAPIGKSKTDFRMRTTSRPTGVVRDAVTEYKVLERFRVHEKLGYDFTYLEAYPKTGRTHQIRVHLRGIHHPVLCDPLYAAKHVCLPEMGRLALHSVSLGITVPSGKDLRFDAELPSDFSETLALLRSLC